MGYVERTNEFVRRVTKLLRSKNLDYTIEYDNEEDDIYINVEDGKLDIFPSLIEEGQSFKEGHKERWFDNKKDYYFFMAIYEEIQEIYKEVKNG